MGGKESNFSAIANGCKCSSAIKHLLPRALRFRRIVYGSVRLIGPLRVAIAIGQQLTKWCSRFSLRMGSLRASTADNTLHCIVLLHVKQLLTWFPFSHLPLQVHVRKLLSDMLPVSFASFQRGWCCCGYGTNSVRFRRMLKGVRVARCFAAVSHD